MRHFFWCLLLGILAPTALLHAQEQAQIVVFVQPGRSISKDFIRNDLPQIKAFAKNEKMPVKVVDATKGAPKEVTITPSVFYEMNDEYTQYEGRYNDHEDFEQFIHSGGESTSMEVLHGDELLVWSTGRSTLAAHCELHPIEGNPSGFDPKKALASLDHGMVYFKKADLQSIPESARSFHLEFFPEKTSDGLMLIHMAMYSEFDLENPVFESEVPSGSEWNEWETAFKKAGKRLEVMLLAQVGSNENGDGFEFVRKGIPYRSWDSLVMVQPMRSKSLSAQMAK